MTFPGYYFVEALCEYTVIFEELAKRTRSKDRIVSVDSTVDWELRLKSALADSSKAAKLNKHFEKNVLFSSLVDALKQIDFSTS